MISQIGFIPNPLNRIERKSTKRTMSWTDTTTNTFRTTVLLRKEDREQRGLRGILPAFQPGNATWMWDNRPKSKEKCLQIPQMIEKSGASRGDHPDLLFGTAAPPIPTAYFGGVGLGFHSECQLDYNEEEGKIQTKQFNAVIAFNDENLAISLKKNRFDLLRYLRELVGGGVWIRFDEDLIPVYTNQIRVKTTRPDKFHRIVQELREIRERNVTSKDKLTELEKLDVIE